MSKTKNNKDSLEYYLNLPYTTKLIPEEAGGYFAEIEELPGCMSQGETQKEALENIEDAKRMWLESMLKKNQVVPEPEITKEYSGKFLLRVPVSLHRRIARLAKKEGVSLNQMALTLLSERVIFKEIKIQIETALWEMESRTKAQYEQEAMKIAQPDTVYDILLEKNKIPKMIWKKPGAVRS
jgi:predicted RNase H-like HicB family nuclease